MLNKIVQAWRWIVKHWAISIAIILVFAIGITFAVFWNVYGKEKKEYITIFVSVSGMGEGRDTEKQKLTVEYNDSLSNVFSSKYPDIYERFQPLVLDNTFDSFMGVRAKKTADFQVTINGTNENNLTQAYTYQGCHVLIEYKGNSKLVTK